MVPIGPDWTHNACVLLYAAGKAYFPTSVWLGTAVAFPRVIDSLRPHTLRLCAINASHVGSFLPLFGQNNPSAITGTHQGSLGL